ncbi:MAG: alanine--tRNA ligase [Pseudomonadales bacterium]|nr:alanine--tRNA ligase [Candidatus Woesebacteria bacterium]MCB9801692.1 alanine--tRNA ligase [Pseudomonadales bacterium]
MTLDQLRTAYIDFFVKRGHVHIPSASLVPENDPTTLFTGSGMQPIVPYLLGAVHPEGERLVNSQRCFRSQDIEDIGDNRHTTFFEMLGNWSLGDYFKREQLSWVFEFLTTVVGIDPAKLYVTVFAGNSDIGVSADERSVGIWKELFSGVGIEAKAVKHAGTKGIQDGRIFYYDDEKNWWSRSGIPAKMPVGEPGGPDSELFYDFGSELRLHETSVFASDPCHVNCDCGRFMEIGNSVFMEFQKTDSGFAPLSQKNVDFGGGLERILAAKHNTPDVFQTDAFAPIIAKLETASGISYTQNSETTRIFRVVADHMRAAVMLAADGVVPGGKGQGYFARRLLRRSVRFAHQSGREIHLSPLLTPVIAQMYATVHPTISEQAKYIQDVLFEEEKKFEKTLEKGLKELEKYETLDAERAFKLYETYGFPFELTQEIARERGQELCEEDFQKAQDAHSQASRSASAGMFKGGLEDDSDTTVAFHTATHLLHAALRQVLGEEVQQKGSNITADRLRFDFSWGHKLTQEEKHAVITQVNDWIDADLPVHHAMQDKAEALKQGALAFFGETYPDTVSVYIIGASPDADWVSKELCGGPHVTSTGQIGHLVLQKEKAVSSGVRRVYLARSG